jgi:alkylation response protein AidB-like acyl-CoA dehydrogenase
MDLQLSPEHVAFGDELRAFIAEHGHRSPTPDDRDLRSPRRLAWQALLLERGYAARTIPAQYGGFGAAPDLLKSHLIASAFSEAGLNRGLAGQGISMLVPTLLELGTPAQRRKYITPTLRGDLVWCQGYSEPEAGSDLASLRTSGVREGDEYVINGQKIWTSTAQHADMMFALVRTEPEQPRHHGITYILVPMSTPGIEVRPLMTMTGEMLFNEVFLTDVRVPAVNVVGEPGEGWQVANATLTHERGMLGDPDAALRRLEQVVTLMKTETIDGIRLIESAVFRDRLLRLQSEALALRAHGQRLMSQRLHGERSGMGSLIVKFNGCELNHQIAALALDVMGELGSLYDDATYLRADGLWQYRYMMDLGLIIGGGTAQIQKNIIAERGLGLPREPRLPAKQAT